MILVLSALLLVALVVSYVAPRRRELFPLALAGCGLSLVAVVSAVVLTVFGLVRVFEQVATLARAEKSAVLAAAISEAMNDVWTSPLGFPVLFVLSVWFLIRARRLVKVRGLAASPSAAPSESR